MRRLLARIRPLTATVFVDDYVRDRLPGVCVVSGTNTPSRMTYRTAASPASGLWFLLLLLPPAGWLVLLLVLGLNQRAQLSGELPLSDRTWQEIRSRNKLGIVLGLAAVVPFGLTVIAPDFLDPVLVAVGLLAIVIGIITYYTGNAKLPGVELDASGRWVTFRGVHPAFEEAVRQADLPDQNFRTGTSRPETSRPETSRPETSRPETSRPET